MPTSEPMTLLDAAAVAASGAGAARGGSARYDGVFGQIGVTTVPVGGASTLDVYIQATADGGTTWRDVAARRFTAAGVQFFQLGQYTTTGTSTLAASDGDLASGVQVQGPFGDRLRVKYAIALNGDTGFFTFGVTCALNGGA